MGSVPRFLQHSAATRRAAFSSMMMMSALIDSARKIAARSPAWSFAMPGEIAFGVCSTDIHAGRFDAQFRTAAGASSWSSSDHDKVAEWRRVRDRSPSICWTCAGVIAPERYDSIATASSTPRVTPPAWAARPCPMSSGMSMAIFTVGLLYVYYRLPPSPNHGRHHQRERAVPPALSSMFEKRHHRRPTVAASFTTPACSLVSSLRSAPISVRTADSISYAEIITPLQASRPPAVNRHR